MTGELSQFPSSPGNPERQGERQMTKDNKASDTGIPTVYDYERQAWVRDGLYAQCGHEGECYCYGRKNRGKAPEPARLARMLVEQYADNPAIVRKTKQAFEAMFGVPLPASPEGH